MFKLKDEFYEIKVEDDMLFLKFPEQDCGFFINNIRKEFTFMPSNMGDYANGWIKTKEQYKHFCITNKKLGEMWGMIIYVDGVEIYQYRYR
jgi:hypothetical protein